LTPGVSLELGNWNLEFLSATAAIRDHERLVRLLTSAATVVSQWPALEPS
jgi:hypothetical protein